jgi:iron complex outermembrane recepter protein
MLRSYTQGASALALAVAFISLNVPPGRAQERPVQEVPTVNVPPGKAQPGRAKEGPVQELPTVDIVAARPAGVTVPANSPTPPGFSEEDLKLPVYRNPTGQTFTSIDVETLKDTPLHSAADLLIYSPGISIKWAGGPRDATISIRGSGNRLTCCIRNIFLMLDGFPFTEPDGLGRIDAIDPNNYSAVDVYRGPSSALFGNSAGYGAINFRTRSGAEVDGIVYGNTFGSFGYINNYLNIGKASGDFDLSLFASDVRGQGFIAHNQFDTQTIDFKGVWSPTPTDRFILKVLHNEMYANFPFRQSLSSISTPSSAAARFLQWLSVSSAAPRACR